jgi:Crinkler effector protein N-terminal domain
MTTRNRYELNCLIEGEEDTLIISVPRAAKVKELKQVIHQEGELQYRLLDLALWKVCREFLI